MTIYTSLIGLFAHLQVSFQICRSLVTQVSFDIYRSLFTYTGLFHTFIVLFIERLLQHSSHICRHLSTYAQVSFHVHRSLSHIYRSLYRTIFNALFAHMQTSFSYRFLFTSRSLIKYTCLLNGSLSTYIRLFSHHWTFGRLLLQVSFIGLFSHTLVFKQISFIGLFSQVFISFQIHKSLRRSFLSVSFIGLFYRFVLQVSFQVCFTGSFHTCIGLFIVPASGVPHFWCSHTRSLLQILV